MLMTSYNALQNVSLTHNAGFMGFWSNMRPVKVEDLTEHEYKAHHDQMGAGILNSDFKMAETEASAEKGSSFCADCKIPDLVIWYKESTRGFVKDICSINEAAVKANLANNNLGEKKDCKFIVQSRRDELNIVDEESAGLNANTESSKNTVSLDSPTNADKFGFEPLETGKKNNDKELLSLYGVGSKDSGYIDTFSRLKFGNLLRLEDNGGESSLLRDYEESSFFADGPGLSISDALQYVNGETSFSSVGVEPCLVSYSGPMADDPGSLSLRSESSATSARSFAFPVLQSEWNTSPVRMAKADRRQLRRHWWRHNLLCCRF